MSTVAIKRSAEIRALILNALKERPYRPIELLQRYQTTEITESALKDVLAELIDAAVIELSSDRHIRLRQSHSTGSLATAR